MIFSSITFLFFFLPIVLWVYFLAPRHLRNLVLLVASLIFYAWGAGVMVLLLGASIAANFVLGDRIQAAIDARDARRARVALGIGVMLDVGLLVAFKYASFASEIGSDLLGALGAGDLPLVQVLLPIGISFYTFHSISYLMDIHRGVAGHLRSPVDFALYIAFFPQLIAGPIVRFHEIRHQLVSRSESAHRFAHGIHRFGHGLAKKVLIADTLAPAVNAIFATPTGQLNTGTALLGILAYTVQLYFDFSGYTDMALGIAQMVGIRLPENFDRPYSSRSVTEFWRRWHMSLSRWFRDYLYIPLGGNRGTSRRTARNLIIVFLVTGLWHGASWTFVAWGAYHGAILLVERSRSVGRVPSAEGRGLRGHALTLVLVMAGWVLFRSPDLDYAMGYYAALFRPALALTPGVGGSLGVIGGVALAVGLASFLLPRDWVTGVRLEQDAGHIAGAIRLAIAVVVLPVALIALVAGTFSPFLYFQF